MPDIPEFEYPSQTRQRQMIEEAQFSKSPEVREAILNELASRQTKFEMQYENARQEDIKAGRRPLGVDPYDPRHRWDKYGQWLAENYGTEQERNLDPRRFEYRTDIGDALGRQFDLHEGSGGGGLPAYERRQLMKQISQLTEQQMKELRKLHEHLASTPGEWMDRNTVIDRDSMWANAGQTGQDNDRPPSIRPKGGRLPLVPTRPGPKGSYFDFYVNPGDPRVQSEQEYDKLVNPKPVPSKGGKFVPIKGSKKPNKTPWREATASQINDRLNQMPDDQAAGIRTYLGL